MRIASLSALQSNRVVTGVCIVQREVAVAHEAVDFQNMNVVVHPLLYTTVNFSFPF